MDVAALGVEFTQAGQHNAAQLCFAEAIRHPDDQERQAPEGQVGVVYGLGLQHLMLRQFVSAMACFQAVAPALQHQSLLWLRMAECAIAMHAAAAGQLSFDGQQQVTAAASAQSHDKESRSAHDTAAAAFLDDAASYLAAAQFLLDKQEARSALPSSTADQEQAESEPARTREAVALAAAYVALQQQNFLAALQQAERLLQLPDLASDARSAAHIAAAETLGCLGRYDESMQRLQQAEDARAGQDGLQSAVQTSKWALLLQQAHMSHARVGLRSHPIDQ